MPDQSIVSAPVPTAPPQRTHIIFRGPNGIRAGWRTLIFFLIIVTEFAIVLLIARRLGGHAQSGVSMLKPSGLAISESVIFLTTMIAAWIMSRIEKRKFGEYGLSLRGAFGKNFWLGTLVGFGCISVCLFGIFLGHGFRITGIAIRGTTLLYSIVGWSAAFIVVGLAEEFAFRGYLQYTLTTGMGFWPAALVTSMVFAFAHAGNPGESKVGLIGVVCFALLFCLFLQRTGNLWLAVGFHAGWDWGQTFFYGVRDSGIAAYHNMLNSEFSGSTWLTGGSVGPEASLITPILLLVVGIVFSRLYRENRYSARP